MFHTCVIQVFQVFNTLTGTHEHKKQGNFTKQHMNNNIVILYSNLIFNGVYAYVVLYILHHDYTSSTPSSTWPVELK